MFILAGNAILLFVIISNTFGIVSQNLAIENTLIATEKASEKAPTPTEEISTTSTITPTPTIKPTTTPSPTIAPEPTEEVVEEAEQETQPEVTTSTSDGSIMGQINDFRATKGLAPLSSESNTCNFANTRANEITSSFNHDGFSQRIDSNSLPYPSYSSIAENIAMNPDPNAVVPAWIASGGHNENMSKNVPYGCVGRSGQYYVLEVWAP